MNLTNIQQPPIIKKYNISIQGLGGNLFNTSQVFEDLLPESNVGQHRMVSLSERTVLHNYIRSILIKRGDGEEIAFKDKDQELLNLLSYMKVLEINPYHFSRITNNALITMPENFLMFRSCYPIRVNKTNSNISCATDNINANIRIYSLSLYDMLAFKLNDGNVRKIFSDVWRELMTYTFLREEILKKKTSPHFPFLHTYYLTENSSIDFDEIKKLQVDNFNDDYNVTDRKIKNAMFKSSNDERKVIDTKDFIAFTYDIDKMTKQVKSERIKSIKSIIDEKKVKLRNEKEFIYDNNNTININTRSSKCLVCITESPTMNIIDWSTKTYVIEDGPIRRQVSTGMHSDITWKSVIFQMLQAFMTLCNARVVIRDFSWPKNVFIKTFDDTGSVGFWKYNINGIDYFIPNGKALVIIDSSYEQVAKGYTDEFTNGMKFKIIGDFLNTPSYIEFEKTRIQLQNNIPDISDYVLMFKQFFNPSELDNMFNLNGGIRPPEEIMDLITAMHEGIDTLLDPPKTIEDLLTDIEHIFMIDNFGLFLHNKIGSIVTQMELPQLYETGHRITDCRKGDIVAVKLDTDSEQYVWGMFISGVNDPASGMYQILEMNNSDKSTIRYTREHRMYTQIRRSAGPVKQNFGSDPKMANFDEMLETYTLKF